MIITCYTGLTRPNKIKTVAILGFQFGLSNVSYLVIIIASLLRFYPSLLCALVPGMKTAEGHALALQAKDPHTKDFTLAILRLHENRFLEKLKRKWWETNIGCPQEQETSKACFALARQAQAQAQAQAQTTGMTQVKTKFHPKLPQHFKLFKSEVIWLNIATSGKCILVLVAFLSGISFSLVTEHNQVYAQAQEKEKQIILELVLAVVLMPGSRPFSW